VFWALIARHLAISDGVLEGTFTLYAVHGLPTDESALLAMIDGGWTFIRATDGRMELGGTHSM
jgi:hypothetical protein